MSRYGENFMRLGRGIYLTCEENPKMLHFAHGGLFIPPLYIGSAVNFECDNDFQAILEKWYNKDGSPNEEYINARLQESHAALRARAGNRGRITGKQRVYRPRPGRRKVFRKCS